MRLPTTLLKLIGKATLNQIGAGVAGDIVFEYLPEVADHVWKWWTAEKPEEERRKELESLAGAGGETVRAEVDRLVAEIANDKTPEVRRALADYLVQVPAMVRRTMRRPGDASGRTVPAGLAPRRAEDLISLLPPRLPRFHSGDRPLRDSDWELDRLLGVGGFGEVWLARNPHLPSAPPAALKFCLDAAAARLLLNEAELLDRVMRQGIHPGIVRLNQTYLRAETPCLEYEFIDGGDLAGLIQDWHAENGGPGAEEAARVAARLAEIVGFAHRLSPPIVHRDLKPANILTFQRGDGSVGFKVADFGIGAIASAPADGEAAVAGAPTLARSSYSPLYASPQQMRGERPDPRDDVFALGVIWRQVLTGDFAEGAPTGIEWPRELAAHGMSERLIGLLASCIEGRAERRPADAAELAERIAEALAEAAAIPTPAKPAPRPLPELPPKTTLSNAGHDYRGRDLLGHSDRFFFYDCDLPDERTGILKIAATAKNNGQLDREAFILGAMADASAKIEAERGDAPPFGYAYFFPEIVDSFIALRHDRRRVNILGFPKEIERLDQLAPLSLFWESENERVDPRSAAWILGKTLKIVAFAHSLGISVGQVGGGNILIERKRHGVVIFDWTLAETHGEGSAPDDAARQDIAQAARAAALALGADPATGALPPDDQLADGRFESFLRRLSGGGYADAARAHAEFYELIRALWPSKFHPFTTHRRG